MKKLLTLLLALLLLFPVVTVWANAAEGERGEPEKVNTETAAPGEAPEQAPGEAQDRAEPAEAAQDGAEPAEAAQSEAASTEPPTADATGEPGEPALDASAQAEQQPEEAVDEPEAELRAEELSEMEATLPQELPEDPRQALCAVALSQLDYEGPVGFIRYTDWCRNYLPPEREAAGAEDVEAAPTEDADAQPTEALAALRAAWQTVAPEDPWDAHFVAFCLHYAGVPMQAYPTAELWAEALGEQLVTEGMPQVGDLLFLALNEEEDAEELPEAERPTAEQPSAELPDEAAPRADHVAILTEIDEDGCLWAVLGDGTVRLILVDPETIVGCAVLPEKEEAPEEPERALPAFRFNADFYALAPEGFRLLRVSDDLSEDESYCFDGQPLKVTEAKGYLLDADAQATFVAFIPNTYSLEEVAALLTAEPVERRALEYSADINEDGVINIADANAVYQMVQNGADYYTEEQISAEARLRLCYSDLRDLNAILEQINGVSD